MGMMAALLLEDVLLHGHELGHGTVLAASGSTIIGDRSRRVQCKIDSAKRRFTRETGSSLIECSRSIHHRTRSRVMNRRRHAFNVLCLSLFLAFSASAQERPVGGLDRQIRDVLQKATRAADDIPEHEERAHALAGCGVRYALFGDGEEAAKCFDKAHRAVHGMPAANFREIRRRCRLLQEIAIARAQGRDWGGARATLQLLNQERLADFAMNAEYERAMAYAFIALHQAKAGLYNEAETTAREIQQAEQRDFAWMNIVYEYAQAKQLQNAHAAAREIGQPRHRARALASIAEAEHRSGKKDDARRSLDAGAALLGGLRPQEIASARIQLAKDYGVILGDEKKALELTTDLPDDKFVQADYEIAWTEIQLAKDDFAKAFVHARKCRELLPTWEYPLRLIGSAQAKAGQTEAALKTAAEFKDSWFTVQVLIDIAQTQHRARQPDKAADTFREAARLVERAPPPSNEFRSTQPQHYFVALAQTEVGEETEARRWALGQVSAVNQAWGLLGVVEGLAQRRQQRRTP
jgi:hypothetical protein